MPEGPEVRRIAEGLNSLLRGKYLHGPHINSSSRYLDKDGNVTLANTHLLVGGARVDNVFPKGKKIIFDLTRLPPYTEKIWMVSSLGMTGRWGLHNGPHSGIVFDVAEMTRHPHYTHINYEKLYYDDQRRFGSLEIGSGPLILEDVGPSFMQDEVSLEIFSGVIRNKRLTKKPIGDFLLEQKYVSGIGNYLRADILYLSAISPFRPLGELSDEDIVRLYAACLDRFAVAYAANGHTIRSYFTPIGEAGSYDPLVYGKEVSPSGNKISTHTKAGRTIHWDSVIQH